MPAESRAQNIPFLLVIEGIDGAGKTTLAASIAAEMRRCGIAVAASKEPTQGKFGQQLRQTAATGRIAPREELALLLLDRREHIENLVGPALQERSIVILDRYYFSNAAYQGSEGLDPEAIIEMNETFAPRADLVLLLDVPPSVGLSRISFRGDLANQFEKPDTLAVCRSIFNSMNRPEIRKIDATMSADRVFAVALELFVVAYVEKARQVFGMTPAAVEAIRPLLHGAYATA